MVQSQFSVAWSSYKSNICGGFSALQQNAEFVDMTIAADGHHVKVHQVLIALASPYLKDLITSAPCQHPVIYLNNVSHSVLRLLLEYIYTGEVLVPADCLMAFGATAKGLHIVGLENITSSVHVESSKADTQIDDSALCRVNVIKRVDLNLGQDTVQMRAEDASYSNPVMNTHDEEFNKVKILLAGGTTDHMHSLIPKKRPKQHASTEFIEERILSTHDYEEIQDKSVRDDDDDWDMNDDVSRTEQVEPAPASNLQFTVSIRGSLQVILNRYIYNLYSSRSTGVRRWRCVDYRNLKCPAFVITKDNTVLNRGKLHNHAFHDKKILSKIEKNAVFSALDHVESYKEKMDTMDAEATENAYGFTIEVLPDKAK